LIWNSWILKQKPRIARHEVQMWAKVCHFNSCSANLPLVATPTVLNSAF
jgi:hypothetical protein